MDMKLIKSKMLLVCGKQKLETTPKQAQSILQIQKEMKRGGWELPKDSPYEFIDNALIKRTDKKDCKPKSKPKGDRARDKASGKAEIPYRDDST